MFVSVRSAKIKGKSWNNLIYLDCTSLLFLSCFVYFLLLLSLLVQVFSYIFIKATFFLGINMWKIKTFYYLNNMKEKCLYLYSWINIFICPFIYFWNNCPYHFSEYSGIKLFKWVLLQKIYENPIFFVLHEYLNTLDA